MCVALCGTVVVTANADSSLRLSVSPSLRLSASPSPRLGLLFDVTPNFPYLFLPSPSPPLSLPLYLSLSLSGGWTVGVDRR